MNNYQTSKVGREYQHIEDLIYINGNQGIFDVLNFFNDIQKNKNILSIKWDGKNVIYWGRNIDSRFSLIPKNAYPKYFFHNKKQLKDYIVRDNLERIDYYNALSWLWDQLEPVHENCNFFNGEVLVNYNDCIIDSKNHYVFNSNQVTYHIDKNSEIAQNLIDKKAIIAVHTEIINNHINYDINKIYQNKNIGFILPLFYDKTIYINQEKINQILDLINKINFDEFLKPEPRFSDFKQIIYRYVNYMSKNQKLDLLGDNFENWLNASNFTESKKNKVKQRLHKYPEQLNIMFDIMKKVISIKNDIIDCLDINWDIIKTTINNTPGGEGYISHIHKIKLVPRHKWRPY